MSDPASLSLTEADVVQLMDLTQAIRALEDGLLLEAAGRAFGMGKTHVHWNGGTMHAIGAVFEGADVAGVKSWAHTEGGASPILTLWNASSGALLAIIEAFALGQMRTGAMSGVATRWMSADGAASLALLGTGKQALAQLAAVAAVRPLREVRIWGRDKGRRAQLAKAAAGLGYSFSIEESDDATAACEGAEIVTVVTRATEPFVTSAMLAPGTHLNAVGAITPEREELAPDVLPRATAIAADDPVAAKRLSRELTRYLEGGGTTAVEPISALVGRRNIRRPGVDLTVFKGMGMGISDVALGVALLRSAHLKGVGWPIQSPRRVEPRLGVSRKEYA